MEGFADSVVSALSASLSLPSRIFQSRRPFSPPSKSGERSKTLLPPRISIDVTPLVSALSSNELDSCAAPAGSYTAVGHESALSALPFDLFSHIFSALDLVALSNAACVNRALRLAVRRYLTYAKQLDCNHAFVSLLPSPPNDNRNRLSKSFPDFPASLVPKLFSDQLERVTLPASTDDESLLALAIRCPNLRSVDLTACHRVSKKGIRSLLIACSHITHVAVGSGMTNEGMSCLMLCKPLEKLELIGADEITARPFKPVSVRLRSLVWEGMEYDYFSNILATMAEQGGLVALEELRISGFWHNVQETALLSAAKTTPNLRVLSTERTDGFGMRAHAKTCVYNMPWFVASNDDASVVPFLDNCPSLHSLVVPDCTLSADLLDRLPSTIVSLHCSGGHVRISNEVVHSIADRLGSLTSLRLDYFSAWGTVTLANLHELRELSLFGSIRLEHVICSPKARLTVLILGYCRLLKEDWPDVIGCSLSELTHLNMAGCIDVTDVTMSKVLAQRPCLSCLVVSGSSVTRATSALAREKGINIATELL
mmetsp:Transcript_17161/g.28225  ORF Transcript_17161/g.28225 Transcript_17161/m.28225 type:complete len:541 (-) Transcript_17161:80-1702(-)|eukprot:CAMPEP_0184645176 /NCGR_PEP_ID=MMETSP0308-20130426/1702_1 /TAXON_ID=38269 /ORGANISM="Gloeochaete witrockiana, Strain SAG 46.84" /LENGTH=540 /DNA_ID=CAMNT_0027074027 /DNA_START=138 /DNA_END=1760 /DNA_ORIENTATION=-